MTITLELSADVSAHAAALAQAKGMDLETYLPTLIEMALPLAESEPDEIRAARNAATIALLDAFAEADEWGTAQEQQETLEYLKGAIDDDRPGQRSIFGEGINP